MQTRSSQKTDAWFRTACAGISTWIASSQADALDIQADLPTFGAELLCDLNKHMITFNAQDETITGPSSVYAGRSWQRGYLQAFLTRDTLQRILDMYEASDDVLVWGAPLLTTRNDVMCNPLVGRLKRGELGELVYKTLCDQEDSGYYLYPGDVDYHNVVCVKVSESCHDCLFGGTGTCDDDICTGYSFIGEDRTSRDFFKRAVSIAGPVDFSQIYTMNIVTLSDSVGTLASKCRDLCNLMEM